MRNINAKYLIFFPIALIIISISYLLAKSNNKLITLSGMIEADEIDVASKIPGRIETVFVERGQKVKQGQLLARLQSKEMDAKVEQAIGMMTAAGAKYQLALNGARIEERSAAENLYLQTKAQFDFAEKSFNRFQSLYEDKVISLQERDEIEFKYKAAKEQMEAAKAKYEMATNGARAEEILAAKALFHQAENVYKEACAYQDELNIIAPTDGEIANIHADQGEIINSGYPLLSIVPDLSKYLTINVREDQLKYFSIGKTFHVNIPALGIRSSNFNVIFISSLGDFANWRPTNQKGDFDLRTFEVRLSNKKLNSKLKPGMTAHFSISLVK